MNLLDLTDDPKTMGLLSLGLRLMSTPGKFGQAFGQAGMGALGDVQAVAQNLERKKQRETESKAAEQRQAMQALQMQQLQQQIQRQQGVEGAYRNALMSPDQNSLPQLNQDALLRSLAQVDPMRAAEMLQPKPDELMSVAPGASIINKRDPSKPVYTAPSNEKKEQSSLAVMLTEMNALPAGHPMRAVYADAIRKATTHAPASQMINYGTPMPAVNPKTGDVELVRPDNRGGMGFTGIKPAPQDRDVKLPAELQRMQIAGDSMVALLTDYEKMLKKHNPRDPLTQMNPAVRSDMQSLKRNIELQFKELQALGALAGPDIQIMRESLADPFTMAGAYYGSSGLLSQVQRARELVKIRADAVLKSQGKAPKAVEVDNDPLGIRKP